MHKANWSLTSSIKNTDLYEQIETAMEVFDLEKYAMVVMDIDNFNYINEFYGFESGDELLHLAEKHFGSCVHADERVFRYHSDIFVFIVNRTDEAALTARFLEIADSMKGKVGFLPESYKIVYSIGMYFPKSSDSVDYIYDCANYARKKAKGDHQTLVRIFNSVMQEEQIWKKQVTFSFERALENSELEAYLQPKVLLKTGKTVGAEALVRWNSPQHGLIYPDKFIPILEQNRLVIKLDLYMLDKVCAMLADCIEQHIVVVPISVNFSRHHIRDKHFVEKIYNIVNRHHVPTYLIEIEFTEYAVHENLQEFIELISEIKQLGFRVSLDDFGQAYSSLNCLKDLMVDSIKIDRGFLQTTVQTERGKIIIAKIVGMIKSLDLVCIMEGVETKEQVEFLNMLNCDIGQGYYFAKPMPISQYIHYLTDRPVEYKYNDCLEPEGGQCEKLDCAVSNSVPREIMLDSWDLYNMCKSFDIGLIKASMDSEVTIQFINDKALEFLGYTKEQLRTELHNSFAAVLHPDESANLQKNTGMIIAATTPIDYHTRAVRRDGKVIDLKGRATCVLDKKDKPLGIFVFNDVTEKLQKESELKLNEQRYRILVEQSGDIVFEWDFETDTLSLSSNYAQLFGYEQISGNALTKPEVLELIHPDDQEVFKEWHKNVYKKTGSYKTELRIRKQNDEYLWMKLHSTAICADDGEPIRAIGTFENINRQKTEIQRLLDRAQNDSLTNIYNKECVQGKIRKYLENSEDSCALFILDIDNFKNINDTLGHQYGDKVLKEMACSLKQSFRDCDIIGRIGGDEFMVLMTKIQSVEHAQEKADKLLHSLNIEYAKSKNMQNTTVSIGVAFFPMHADNFNDLYACADVALYRAKGNGKNTVFFYNGELEPKEYEIRNTTEQENFLSSYFSDDPVFNIFEMLYETKKMDISMSVVLEIIGKKFNVDRVYIFEISGDGQQISNSYEWCNEGIGAEIQNLQNLDLPYFQPLIQSYNQDGILICDDLTNMSPLVYSILEPQGIKSMLHCALNNQGVIGGFIGFDCCTHRREWKVEEVAALAYVSRILSVFLFKTQVSEKLKLAYENHMQMLDNMAGFLYVVDEKYDMLYANNATKFYGAVEGTKCYAMAFDRDEPCENCPVKKLNENTTHATEQIYSVHLGKWVNSTASKMVWSGGKNAALVHCIEAERK